MHGDDTQLVFFVDPDEERLVIVVEDTTASRPVAVKATRLQEPVALLEQEVVINELVLHLPAHSVQWVELALKVTLERAACLHDLFHDLISLFVCDARTKRIIGKVATNSDTCRIDQGAFFLGERRAPELASVHVGDMVCTRAVTMIVFNDSVKEPAEGFVGVGRACVASDAGVDVLAAGEDAYLERDAGLVLHFPIAVPDILRKVLAHERLAVIGELRQASQIFGLVEVRSALSPGQVHLGRPLKRDGGEPGALRASSLVAACGGRLGGKWGFVREEFEDYHDKNEEAEHLEVLSGKGIINRAWRNFNAENSQHHRQE